MRELDRRRVTRGVATEASSDRCDGIAGAVAGADREETGRDGFGIVNSEGVWLTDAGRAVLAESR